MTKKKETMREREREKDVKVRKWNANLGNYAVSTALFDSLKIIWVIKGDEWNMWLSIPRTKLTEGDRKLKKNKYIQETKNS